ncbi:MAG TPA: AMIN domain-containing protein, partial [Acidobacteriota bacterium]|nr:AMIN domain-containing protein [Acidobacteriota bacterium]
MADDLVSLKNLAWEEQTGKTRIILETSKPLVYNVTASGKSSELAVELSNLDLRNLPQELFLNTDQVVSLQTFPQTDGQKAKIIVKMTAFGPHEVTADGNKLYIDIESAPSADRLVNPTVQAPAAAPAAQSVQPEKVEPAKTETPVQNVTDHPAVPQAKAAEPEIKQVAESKPLVENKSVVESKPAMESKPAVESKPKQAEQPVSPATQVRDIRIDSTSQESADVVVVGDGSFDYTAFELTNPQRLVVDLKSVMVAPSVKSSVVSSCQLFSKVRIGQFQVSPRVTRAVIDLNMKVPYNITKQGKELRIHLGEGSATSASDSSLPAEPANQNTDTQDTDNSVAVAQSTPAPVEEPQDQPATPEATTASTPEPAAQIPAPSVAAPPQVAQAAEAEKMTKDEAKPSTPMKDDQFFAIKPDTSPFAQDEGATAAPPPPPTTTGGTGMGTFQEKTVKSGEKQYTGEPFSFDFKDIDIADLFRFIA